MSRLPTHYKTLGIVQDTSPELVRAAYRHLAQKYHPDRYEGRGDSAATMARINQAYDVLSDPQSRAAYDESIRPVALPASPGRAGAAMDMPVHRPWLLVWFVASLTVLALGWVAVRTLVPRPVQVPMPVVVQRAPVVEPPLAPVPAIEPWKPPPPAVRTGLAETEPVMRLVREGTMPSPSPRRD